MQRANPYPGLRPFEEEDAPLFFGREAAVGELLTLLKEQRFLAVLGLSGSGKSSLIRAGLLPALHLGAMGEEFADWRVATFQPGMDPIGAMSAALDDPDVLGGDPDGRSLLERSGRGLAERALRASLPDGSYLLVFVDQFEEIFRFQKAQVQGPDQAVRFVRLLLEASQHEWSRVHVLITMRSDFLGECAQFTGLPEALKQGQYLVRGMTPDQRRDAIIEPARLSHIEVSEELVQRVLNDVGEDPARLPVMQHALMRTCDIGTPGPLTVTHYSAAGKMDHALDAHAQKLFDELDPNDQAVTRRMFKSLADRRAGARDTRRPTTVEKLAAVCGVPEETIKRIYKHFSGYQRTFLTCRNAPSSSHLDRVAGGTKGLTSESLVDVTHESLLHNWRLLNRWIDQEEELGRRFLALAEEWLKRPNQLLDGNYLALAKQWVTEVEQDLPPRLSEPTRLTALEAWAQRYPVRQGQVETSVDFARVRELIEKSDEAASREAERRQRRDTRDRFVRQAALLSLLLVLILGLAYWRTSAQAKSLREQGEVLTGVTGKLTQANSQLASETHAKDVALEQAKKDKSDAEGAKKDAQQLQKLAQNQAGVEKNLREREQKALKDTNKALEDAKIARDEAQNASSAERLARIEADRARDETDMQRRIAVSRSLFAESALVLAQKASLLPTSIAIGLVALHNAGSEVAIASQAADAWRASLGLMPRPVGRASVSQQERLESFASSPKGDVHAIASLTDSDTTIVRLINGKGEPVREPLTSDEPLSGLIFSHDGQYLAALGLNSALIWNTRTGTLRKMTHKELVNTIAFSPDSQTIATGSDDGKACIWMTESVKQVRCMTHPGSEYVITLDFSPDGQQLATGTDENIARVWNVANGGKIAEIVHADSVNAVRFDRTGRMIATASSDNSVRLSQLPRGKTVELKHPGQVTLVEFGSDNLVATAASDNVVRLWTTSGRPVANLTHENKINSIAISPDGRHVATASADNTARIWDNRGTETARAVHDASVIAVNFSADGRHFATASLDRTARVWEMPSGPEVLRTIEGGADRAVFGGQGKAQLAVIGRDENLRLYDLSEPAGKPRQVGSLLQKADEPVQFRGLALSEDGRYVAALIWRRNCASSTRLGCNEIQIVDQQSGQVRPIPTTTERHVLALDAEGKYLAVSSGRSVRIWRAGDGKELDYTLQHSGTVNAVAFSPDGRYVATGSNDTFAMVCDVATGKECVRLRHGETEYVIALQFDAEGQRLATGTDEGQARVWEWHSGKEARRFRHADAVTAVALDQDGKHLATTSDDNTAMLWDLSAASSDSRRFDLSSPGRAVAFTSDGQKLVTVTLNGTVGTWTRKVVFADPSIEACGRLPRNLSAAEWKTHVGNDPPYRKICPDLP